MHKNNDKVAFLVRHFYITRYFIHILEHMHHIGIIFRHPDAVCAVCIIEKREPYAVSDQYFIGPAVTVLFGLNAEAQNPVVLKKRFRRTDSFFSPVKRVIRRACHHVKTGMHNRLSHLNRRAKKRVIPVHGGVFHKRRFLIHDGYVAFRNHIPYVFIQKIKS